MVIEGKHPQLRRERVRWASYLKSPDVGASAEKEDQLLEEDETKHSVCGRIATILLSCVAGTIFTACLCAAFSSVYPNWKEGLPVSALGFYKTDDNTSEAVEKKPNISNVPLIIEDTKCLGSVSIAGQGTLQIIRAGGDGFTGYPRGKVVVSNFTSIMASKATRAYFGEGCTEGNYSNLDYKAFILPGRTLSYDVDLSETNCGCSAVLSLVNMRYSEDPGQCDGDFYCDADAECGVRCAEAKIMQANRFTWTTSLHDTVHGMERQSMLFGQSYRPESKCINTDRPFRVDATVSLDASSLLVKLTQGHCFVETVAAGPGLDRELRRGMTLALSYIRIAKEFGHTACKQYSPQFCPESVKLSRFKVAEGYR
eukprot:CAMPEP_0172810222 /NCGR_PEP_ID=MMETSP1075-20121228/8667_1 /TAXON_ID=2916 /ORGANISM="Ceratium fusus, Strain PA161109" /LENGTH=368 /DNA_ID=CAMNT_0013649501 /DNA_START=612 /DNA_END=1718 /DNA_ORIENTATION=-